MSEATFGSSTFSERQAYADEAAGFDYKPVPTIAPIAMAIAVLGLSSLLALFGIPVAIIALVISLVAWRTISVSQGQYGGKGLAISAFVVSLIGVVAGIAIQIQLYRTEIPEGFERVSFNYDISKPGVGYQQGADGKVGLALPPSTKSLDGQKVFVKGFMYPEDQQVGLKKFLLVKDSGDCCFGGQPAIQDIIGVRFDEESAMTARYHNQALVSVAGEFRIRKDFTGASLEPVYEIVATHFSRSKSSF